MNDNFLLEMLQVKISMKNIAKAMKEICDAISVPNSYY